MNDFSYAKEVKDVSRILESPKSRNFSKLEKNKALQLPIMSSKNIINVKSYTTKGRKPNSIKMSDTFIERINNKTHITEKEGQALYNTGSNFNTSLNWKTIDTEKVNIRQDLGKIDLSDKYVVEIKKHLITKEYPNVYAKNTKIINKYIKKKNHKEEEVEVKPSSQFKKQNNTNKYKDKIQIPNETKINEDRLDEELSEESYMKDKDLYASRNSLNDSNKNSNKNIKHNSNKNVTNSKNIIDKQENLDYDNTFTKDKKHRDIENRIKGMLFY